MPRHQCSETCRVIVMTVSNKNGSDLSNIDAGLCKTACDAVARSTTYSALLTINRLDDCARWALGIGPPCVPSVISRVPQLVGWRSPSYATAALADFE